VDLAIQRNKAIAIENLKRLTRGMHGDGKATLRKILHQWNVKKFLQKLIRVAMLKGVEVISEPSSCEGANGRNPSRGEATLPLLPLGKF